ncbi:MAG: hypothetical protein EOO38_08855, partial [Cytophagaceae bacterium]
MSEVMRANSFEILFFPQIEFQGMAMNLPTISLTKVFDQKAVQPYGCPSLNIELWGSKCALLEDATFTDAEVRDLAQLQGMLDKVPLPKRYHKPLRQHPLRCRETLQSANVYGYFLASLIAVGAGAAVPTALAPSVGVIVGTAFLAIALRNTVVTHRKLREEQDYELLRRPLVEAERQELAKDISASREVRCRPILVEEEIGVAVPARLCGAFRTGAQAIALSAYVPLKASLLVAGAVQDISVSGVNLFLNILVDEHRGPGNIPFNLLDLSDRMKANLFALDDPGSLGQVRLAIKDALKLAVFESPPERLASRFCSQEPAIASVGGVVSLEKDVFCFNAGSTKTLFIKNNKVTQLSIDHGLYA